MSAVISVIDAVLGAFALLLPVREATGHNDGPVINAIQASTGNASGDPYCQSTTWYVGSGVLGARWPMPKTASCQAALAHARALGLERATPQRGDQFFVLDANGIAHHTGLVEAVDGGGRWKSLEGNTNDDGARDGVGMFRRIRGAGPDRNRYTFARWIDAVAA